MAEINQFITTGLGPAPSRRVEIVRRTLLCAVVALVEALSAGALLFTVALVYHLLFLHESLEEFRKVFYLSFALLSAALYAIFAALECNHFLDRTGPSRIEPHQSLYGWTATIALTLLAAFLLGRIGDLSRVTLTAAYFAGVPLMYVLRLAIYAVLDTRIRSGNLHFETVAVIGNRDDVRNFLSGGEIWRQGHRLTDTLNFEDARDGAGKLDPRAVSAFASRCLKQGTDHIVFVGTLADLDELDRVVAELKRYALNLLYAPAAHNRSLKFLDVVAIGPNNVLRFVRTPLSNGAVLLKRAFDLVLAIFGLVVLSPLFALVALAIRIESRGPVIYRQARRGFNGDSFMIWKFRSMTVTESGYAMRQAQHDDVRITRIGRILRATSIDELPQLVNVLTGQMSLVGPRPHAISHDEELSRQLAGYAHRQRIKPGITGWAQVHGYRGETSSPAQIEGRVAHDIYYIDHWSIILDLWILVLTVISPAARRNAR